MTVKTIKDINDKYSYKDENPGGGREMGNLFLVLNAKVTMNSSISMMKS